MNIKFTHVFDLKVILNKDSLDYLTVGRIQLNYGNATNVDIVDYYYRVSKAFLKKISSLLKGMTILEGLSELQIYTILVASLPIEIEVVASASKMLKSKESKVNLNNYYSLFHHKSYQFDIGKEVFDVIYEGQVYNESRKEKIEHLVEKKEEDI